MADPTSELVLVTGGSGFIAIHCIVQCLTAGYRVRTTVRSSQKEEDVRSMLEQSPLQTKNPDRLTFAIADLLEDDGWQDAVNGCTYVLHVASPAPTKAPKHENDIIIPACEGTIRVLSAARTAGVKRVVLTSSFSAIGRGSEPKEPYTEKDWTDPNAPRVNAYQKSKTLAERAAWDFVKDGSLELSVVNPVYVLGPVFGPSYSSIKVVQRLLNGSVSGCPQIYFGIVDVRDVADLHLRAMTDVKAKGERFLASSPPCMSVHDIALTLHERMGDVAKKVPRRVLPNLLVRFIALFDQEIALVATDLGVRRETSNEKAKTMLGWNPRSNSDAVVATGESLVKLGLLK